MRNSLKARRFSVSPSQKKFVSSLSLLRSLREIVSVHTFHLQKEKSKKGWTCAAYLFASFDLHDSGSLRSFGPLHDLEADTVSLLKCPIPVYHNPRIVDKDIRSVFTAYEPIALGVAEPLDLAFHFCSASQDFRATNLNFRTKSL
jgi:hypothetical protein